ncbi:hypothetical protein CRV02_10650 [Arcobacter sp. CECT 8989]|uniref:DUF2238 domain-containing protein n=1 Tax=Arcobacter sp. CECT 8989 TaxID=2044509 RepID=UPI00100A7EF7|nr:DUF2238 domain-containing protein [Arcobacter sp. CECT 8989]RXJ99819.1 hypothetical protein CRV02_10650 [Arcobacter sp. CECT 8989]
MAKSHKIIYSIYILIWIILAINPKYPEDWFLENILVFLLFPFVLWSDIKYKFTLLSIFFLLIFASLHSLGAHFTYAQMEYFNVITQLFGFERNHFDRVVHFLFGLLVFRSLFEIVVIYSNSLKSALFFSFSLVVCIATIYELVEWFAAFTFYPELGMAFLGIQGDIWDAHKDTLLACIGALINIMFYKHYKKLWVLKKFK